MPRSGTKLLRELLNNHEAISFTTNETEFLPFLIEYSRYHNLNNKYEFEHFYNYFLLEDYVFFRKIDGYKIIDKDHWYNTCSDFSPYQIFNSLLRNDCTYDSKTIYLGDKSPSYIKQLPLITKYLPKLNIIHIVRNPRNQISSMKNTFGRNPISSAYKWKETITHFIQFKNKSETLNL